MPTSIRLIAVTATVLLLLLGCQQQQATPPAARVLFDQGHHQQFLIEGKSPLDLSNLAELFRQQRCQVASTDQRLTDSLLTGYDVLVISGPFEPFAKSEMEAIAGFIEAGGRLSVMLHVAAPAADLLQRLGVAISNGVIREQEGLLKPDEAQDFTVSRFASHPITTGLDGFAMYGAWALLPITDQVHMIAETGPSSWIDLNKDGKLMERDAMQSFGVIATGLQGNGSFVVFSDDAIFQNQFLQGNNRILGNNLVSWLLPESVTPKQ